MLPLLPMCAIFMTIWSLCATRWPPHRRQARLIRRWWMRRLRSLKTNTATALTQTRLRQLPQRAVGGSLRHSRRATFSRPPPSCQAQKNSQPRRPAREENNILIVIQRVREWTLAIRWSVVIALCAGAVVAAGFIGPMAQPQIYHHFADQRT